MILYRFTLCTYREEPEIRMSVVEVDEKPKTYQTKGRFFSRIKKSEIGCLTGYCRETVYLLENDFEKAKELFVEKTQDSIADIENSIKLTKRRLEETRNKLEVLKKLESAESED